MRHKKQLLLIPLTIWSGLEQGFFGADFTAVILLTRSDTTDWTGSRKSFFKKGKSFITFNFSTGKSFINLP